MRNDSKFLSIFKMAVAILIAASAIYIYSSCNAEEKNDVDSSSAIKSSSYEEEKSDNVSFYDTLWNEN